MKYDEKLLVIIVIVSCFSFHYKKKKVIPPGTVQITETFFADETEVSNFSWREYETWVKTKYGYHSKEHLATLPDTLVWRDKVTCNEAYTIHYYRHAAYKDYPVVGVSYEQVIAFCKWRTERVKEYYAVAYHKEISIDYHLPSREEWELISNNGSEVFYNEGWNKKNQRLLNCAWEADSTKIYNSSSTSTITSADKGGDVTAPVYSYWQNRFGLFNAFGNVAEMISEKGISKGGSWRQHIEECRAGKDINYSGPKAWLGFRCVCTLKGI